MSSKQRSPSVSSETDQRFAEFDQKCKTYLSGWLFLSHILHMAVEEFRGKDISWIYRNAFCGEPVDISEEEAEALSTVRRIHGANSEDIVLWEGERRFDVLFPARYDLKDKNAVVWVDLEAQKSDQLDYSLMDRAPYYVSRMSSREYRRDFVKSEYANIRKVYSIWVVMFPHKLKPNHVYPFNWVNTKTLERKLEDEKVDPAEIQIICLGKEAEDSDTPIIHFLYRLLAPMDWDKRIQSLEKDYNITLDHESEKEMEDMCNLGEGFYEEGVFQGRVVGEREGKARGIVEGQDKEKLRSVRLLMKTLGLSMDEAMSALEFSDEERIWATKELTY